MRIGLAEPTINDSLWECDLRSERDVACERCCDAGKGAGVGSVCLEGTGSDTKWAIGS